MKKAARLIIQYKLLLRKVYISSINAKEKNKASNNLGTILAFINIFSILILLEWALPIKGIIYLSHTKALPMAPTAMLVFGILYGTFYFTFPQKKYNAEQIGIIRTAFERTKKNTRSTAIIYLIISIIMFVLSLNLVFTKYG